MEIKNNQKILCGIDGIVRAVKLSDIVHELVSQRGLVTISSELGIDKSALSRFKNGQGALTLGDIEKILEYSEITVIPAVRYRRLISNLISMSELLKGALGW